MALLCLELLTRADHLFRAEHSSPGCAQGSGVIGRRYDAGVDSIIAVRVRLDSGVDRYFLTWGDLGSNRRWPGDIEKDGEMNAGPWSLTLVEQHLGEQAVERWSREPQ